MIKNEFLLLEALAGISDYIRETEAVMKENNMDLCDECKKQGLKFTFENEYSSVLDESMETFRKMYDDNKDTFDEYQKLIRTIPVDIKQKGAI